MTRSVPLLLLVLFVAVFCPYPAFSQDQTGGEPVVQSSAKFAFDLHPLIGAEQPNLIYSPYSIYAVLALLYAGAEGTTAEQMAEVMHISSGTDDFHGSMERIQKALRAIQKSGNIELGIANALWPQTGLKANKGFLKTAKRYDALVRAVDYRDDDKTRDTINTWVEEQTNNRIKDLVNWDLHPLTYLLITNAIYFKGNWARQFNAEATNEMPFTLLGGNEVNVPMMTQMNRFKYGETEAVQVLRMPYIGGDVAMYVVLPRDKTDVRILSGEITLSELNSWIGNLHSTLLEIYFPRFKVESEFNLIETLASMGMTKALDPKEADFTGIGGEQGQFFIKYFVHKAFIEVNEEGTEAAAATVGGCLPKGTLVSTPEGLKPIEELEKGSPIHSYDIAGGKWVISRITEHYTFPFDGDMISIGTNAGTVEATWNHPFLVVDGERLSSRPVPKDLTSGETVSTWAGRWVEARDVQTGDRLLGKNGGTVQVLSVSKKRRTERVYCVETDTYHNFVISESRVLVHNGGKGESAVELNLFQADHPFLYFIRDESSGSILFMGRVVRPHAE